MNIVVFGTGYVGLSLAVLLSQQHKVTAVDIIQERIELINSKISPIKDSDIECLFREKKLDLVATNEPRAAIEDADYVIIATPTNFDPEANSFDTSSVDSVISQVRATNSVVPIVIKSTIPVGYVREKNKQGYQSLFFSPEFLREGRALYDNLYPSRIIVGSKSKEARKFAEILREVSLKKDVPVYQVGEMEAEAIKLFSNAFLAMRVSFFNELDTYASITKLNSREIIDCVCEDPRIGAYYNNPSFGYGGYCLPKDTKQLLSELEGVPQSLFKAVVNSNNIRKNFIAQLAIDSGKKNIGVYRLAMKQGSDNFRYSAILDIISILKAKGKSVLIYEPSVTTKEILGCPVVEDLEQFKLCSELILANRWNDELSDVGEKVITKDIYCRD
ncbi:nucleotide sugar dehydrogenase [Turicimonas muris]|uniref:nucleotide sugar dehydrogenase n=1 Tax=Turicimonas muris TaxID=1796652 RepID=UPI0032B0F3DA